MSAKERDRLETLHEVHKRHILKKQKSITHVSDTKGYLRLSTTFPSQI